MADRVFIQNDAFALPTPVNVMILIVRGLNPTRIATCLRFEFQERIYILYKQTYFA